MELNLIWSWAWAVGALIICGGFAAWMTRDKGDKPLGIFLIIFGIVIAALLAWSGYRYSPLYSRYYIGSQQILTAYDADGQILEQYDGVYLVSSLTEDGIQFVDEDGTSYEIDWGDGAVVVEEEETGDVTIYLGPDGEIAAEEEEQVPFWKRWSQD